MCYKSRENCFKCGAKHELRINNTTTCTYQCKLHKKWCVTENNDCGTENVCSVCTDDLLTNYKGHTYNGRAIISYKDLKFYDSEDEMLCKPSDLQLIESKKEKQPQAYKRRKRNDAPEILLAEPDYYDKTNINNSMNKKPTKLHSYTSNDSYMNKKKELAAENKVCSLD